MTAENNIDIKIKELAQSIAPDEKLVENVMKHIDTESTDGSYGTTQNTWRIIIKSPITKFAAAAVIVVTVLISINPFNGSLNGTTAAYAKVKEAVRNVPWMHISYSGYILDEMGNKKSEEGELDTEIWYSFKSQVVIQKYHGGLIKYYNYTKQEVHTYNPDSKRIVITALSGKKFPLEAATPWSWLERNIQRMTSFGGEVTRKKGQYNGQDVEVYEIVSADRPGIASIQCKVFVDRATSLPIAEERKYINTNIGKPQRIEKGAFDYPEQGPKDIYAIGLPSDTPTINSLPLPSWWDIKRVYQSHRRKAPQKYIAIVTSELSIPNTPVECVNIYYTDGVRFREERHFLFRPGPVGVQWRQQAAEIGNTFDSILKWSQECKAHGQISISIYDGNHCYNSHREDNGVWKTTKHTTKGKDRKMTASDFWHMCPITRIGWPDIRGYADVIQNEYARKNKLICIEAQTQKFYLNPNRDYICHKKIINNYQVTDVIEYGQTKEGMWYPKRTKGLGKSNTIFLETDPEFPEEIFDPENLPK
jgi:hypothetical protein